MAETRGNGPAQGWRELFERGGMEVLGADELRQASAGGCCGGSFQIHGEHGCRDLVRPSVRSVL